MSSLRFRSIVAFLVLLSPISCSTKIDGEKILSRVDATEALSFKPPVPEEWTMANGLTVLLLKDDELPLVSGNLYIPGGEIWEDSKLPGVIGAMGTELRDGGAGKLKPDELDRELQKLSASIGSAFGGEYGNISFDCLSGDLERVLSLFSDVVLRPRFDQSRLDLWRGQVLEGIRRRTDDPGTVAGTAFTQLLYDGTPYGRVLVSSDIERITRTRILQAYRDFVRPEGAILAVSGDVTREKLEPLLENLFGEWRASSKRVLEYPPLNSAPEPGIYFIEQPVAQSTIQIGQLGVPRLSPDYPDIDVFNEVFGAGGFGSKLMLRVRTELGLVYGIYGAIVPGVVRGRNIIGLQTKAASTGDAIRESIAVLESMQNELVKEAELGDTKRVIQNSFVFKFDSPAEVVRRRALLKLLRYPLDYDETYLPKIRGVNPLRVQQVARNRWQVGELVIVVVGNETAYNSLQQMLRDPPPSLKAKRLRKVRFKEKLVLNSN